MSSDFNPENDLRRFHEAQDGVCDRAKRELSEGGKRSHWMWFVFPQLKGLGSSVAADYYGIAGKAEAMAYLDDPVLSRRLREICEVLLGQRERDPEKIFGHVDAMKLRSSMTLFDQIEPCGVFRDVLSEFFENRPDALTLELLKKEK